MRYPKLRELWEALRALLSGPYTSGYPKKPHKARWGYRGRPTPNDEYCIGCEACARVCPAGAIKIIDEGATRRIVRLYDVCNYCGQCEYWCTTIKGVQLTPEYELSTFDRTTSNVEQRFEMVLCEHCGARIATRAHLRWIAKKLGPLAYGNPTLLLNAEHDAQSDTPATPELAEGSKRADLFRMLCPKCRHQAYVIDEYGPPR